MGKLIRYFKLKREFKKYIENDKPDNKERNIKIDEIKYVIKKKHTGNFIESYGTYYELINKNIEKVVFRIGHYTNSLDNFSCQWYDEKQTYYKNL